jgi:hypothetical protein
MPPVIFIFLAYGNAYMSLQRRFNSLNFISHIMVCAVDSVLGVL